jgi:hypothetical protein
MREKIVPVRALEGDDLERGFGVDRLDEVEDLVVHQIINGIDRRVIEGDPPISGHLLVDGDCGGRLFHRALPAFVRIGVSRLTSLIASTPPRTTTVGAGGTNTAASGCCSSS